MMVILINKRAGHQCLCLTGFLINHCGPANLGNRLMKSFEKIFDLGFQNALSYYFKEENLPPARLSTCTVVL